MPKAVKRKTRDSKEKRKYHKKSKPSSEEISESIEKIKLKDTPFVGELLFCGGTNWDLTGRWRLPKFATKEGCKPPLGGRNLLGPHRLSSLQGIRIRNVLSGPHACHSIIITEDGQAMSWGRNEQEQLGLAHADRVDSPTLIEGLKNKHIVSAACGTTHTLCLTDEGSVYAFGDNRLGQLGIGCQSASMGTPCKIDYHGNPIVQVACGGEFSMILDCKGNLHSFGCQEYSQAGHNSNGKFAVKGTKTSSQNITAPKMIVLYVEKQRDGTINPLENIVMKDVVCGNNHTVAIDMQNRVFTWGFGGYGRLGHMEPRDEPVPRSLKFFEPSLGGRNASKIYAGSSYSMVLSAQGQLYFWGQTKSTGEATMYPKPVHDLSGWTIRSVGCSNSSIVIAAEDSIISWGPSPTYGELGYGENSCRSSTHAQKAKPVEGIHVFKVACGMGHSLFLCRDEEEEDKVLLSNIPIFNPRQTQSIPGTPYVPKSSLEVTADKDNCASETQSNPATTNDSDNGKDEMKTEDSTEQKETSDKMATPKVPSPSSPSAIVPVTTNEVEAKPKPTTHTSQGQDSAKVVEPSQPKITSVSEDSNKYEDVDTFKKTQPNGVTPLVGIDDGASGDANASVKAICDEPLNLTKKTTTKPIIKESEKTHQDPPPVNNAHVNSIHEESSEVESPLDLKKSSELAPDLNQSQTNNRTVSPSA